MQEIFGGEILTTPVTIGLVAICFAVCVVVIGIVTYFSHRYQTKEDAKSASDAAILKEADLKNWIRKVEGDVTTLQTSMNTIGRDVSYIRGRLEPQPK